MSSKILKFEDVPVWRDSLDMAVKIYEITTSYPKEEMYGLTSQIRRSGSSVSANIAEGFGRSTNKDKSHFYHIALGSLLETKNFLYLALRLNYASNKDISGMIKDIEKIRSQITAILRYLGSNE